jgi:hypothetical protein
VGLTKKFWNIEDLENKPTSQLPMSLNVNMVVTDTECMTELFKMSTSLSQDSYLTQPFLLAHPTFPHLRALLMLLALMFLALSPLPSVKNCYSLMQVISLLLNTWLQLTVKDVGPPTG